MNNILFLIFISFFISFFIGCSNNSISLYKEYGLKGEVKSVTRINLGGENQKDTSRIDRYEFNRENRLVELNTKVFDFEDMDEKATLKTIEKYEYNTHSNLTLIRGKSYYEDNSELNYTRVYIYENNKLKVIKHYDKEVVSSENMNKCEKYEYENDVLISQTTFDGIISKKNMITCNEYKYKDGILIEMQVKNVEMKSNNSDTISTIMVSSKFDKNGLYTDLVLFNSPNDTVTREYTFDKVGSWINVESYLNNELYGITLQNIEYW